MTDRRCTCDAPPARIAAGCPVHGLPALHAAGRSTRGPVPDLVIVDNPIADYDAAVPLLEPYDRGGIVPRGELPKIEHPTGYVIPGPWLDRAAPLTPTELERQLADVYAPRPYEPHVEIAAPRQAELKPTLATMHAGEWRLTRDDVAAAGSPLEQLAAIRPAPMPDRQRDQLRRQIARAFDVPFYVVDDQAAADEHRLRQLEADRWADDGGSYDDPLDLPPIVLELRADGAGFLEAIGRAARQLFDPFRRLADAIVATARAFGLTLDALRRLERPVDRARRQRVATAMRRRARRADRRRRIAARREYRARLAAPWYAIQRAGLDGVRALDVLRAAAWSVNRPGAYLVVSSVTA